MTKFEKILKIIAIVLLCTCGIIACSSPIEQTYEPTTKDASTIELIERGYIETGIPYEIIRDTETGVEYVIVNEMITPRYDNKKQIMVDEK